MTITLKDIAREAGFSVTTVSRALTGYDDVSDSTRQHIIDIAQRLGYQPNGIARQLRSQRTNTIGLIIPEDDFSDGFFNQFIMGMGRVAARHHYDLLISTQEPGVDEISAYHRIAGGNRVDGMVVARTRQDDPRLDYLLELKLPFVVSGRSASNSNFPFIDADSQAGVRMAVNHLTALGHQHIGLILSPKDMVFTGYRFTGYCLGLEDAGIGYREEYVVTGDLRRSGGYVGAQYLLEYYPHITALVACNDLMALGALQAIQERDLQVGGDIAVVGFDDIPAAEHTRPSLTTVRQPIYEIGSRLVEILVDIIEGRPPKELQVLLQPTLVIRDSTGC